MPHNAAHTPRLGLLDLLGSLSLALDLVSPLVVDHHKRVAYVAGRLAGQLGLPREEAYETLLAGLIHDIGAFGESAAQRLDTLRFETDQVGHSEVGFRLLAPFPGLGRMARIVRRHHTWFEQHSGLDEPVADLRLSGLVQLADRVDALLRIGPAGAPLHTQAADVVKRVRARSGTMFAPAAVDALAELARYPGFWEDLESPDLCSILRGMAASADRTLDLDEALRLSGLFSQVIDFRSRFTATHSRGVAAAAVSLCRLAGFNEESCKLMHMAGDLHDLGKLAVPRAILEKPGKLDEEEFRLVKRHALLTHEILGRLPGLEVVRTWAASHHERLDGSGYPFSLTQGELEQGARIMAVADVFTALAEDRPYRAGMDREETLSVLRDMAQARRLDPAVVEMVAQHFAELDQSRRTAQDAARAAFERFSRGEEVAA